MAKALVLFLIKCINILKQYGKITYLALFYSENLKEYSIELDILF